jgi:transcriptional regulator with XRE-family HTH domain
LDYSVIGKKIKELRKAVGLTQGDLAEGICTQALISRIEKGDIYPSATALYQIALKLGVDVNYFFEIGTTPRIDYVREVERQLKTLRFKRKFTEMIEMVRTEEKNPFFYKDNEKLQLLNWHKAIYLFEVEEDHASAFSVLHQAYELTAHPKKAPSERELEILMTFGTWEKLLHNNDKALDYYHKVEDILKQMEHLNDQSINTRLLYNIARVLTQIENYEESIAYCHKGINWCLEEEHLWGLGELHYHIGYNYEKIGDFEKALPYVDKAIQLFILRNDDTHLEFLERRKREIVSKIKGGD